MIPTKATNGSSVANIAAISVGSSVSGRVIGSLSNQYK
jgi:hypothetical protein